MTKHRDSDSIDDVSNDVIGKTKPYGKSTFHETSDCIGVGNRIG